MCDLYGPELTVQPYLTWVWVALACAAFVTAWVFPTYFRHLNVPVGNFADKNRMEGKEQPSVLAKRDFEEQA